MSKVAQNIEELFHGALRLWAAGVQGGGNNTAVYGQTLETFCVHIIMHSATNNTCKNQTFNQRLISHFITHNNTLSAFKHTHTLGSVHLKFRPSLAHGDWLGQRLRLKSRLSCKRSAHVCTSKLAWVTQHYQYSSDHQPLGGLTAQQRKVSGCSNAKTQENLMLHSLTKRLGIKERNPLAELAANLRQIVSIARWQSGPARHTVILNLNSCFFFWDTIKP